MHTCMCVGWMHVLVCCVTLCATVENSYECSLNSTECNIKPVYVVLCTLLIIPCAPLDVINVVM